jgi:hypothetical protein
MLQFFGIGLQLRDRFRLEHFLVWLGLGHQLLDARHELRDLTMPSGRGSECGKID